MRTTPRLLPAAIAVLTIVLAFTPSATAAMTSQQNGEILYSPDLSSFPNATAGYPRAIRLEHGGTDSALLATFAKSGQNENGTLPIYKSIDNGNTWNLISTITAHTSGWDIEAPTLFEVPYDAEGLNAGDILAAGTAWAVGDYTAQKIEVFRSTDKGQSWSYLSNCTETSGLPNTWGHGIWEPVFRQASDGTLACFISDERPDQSPTNNQVIGHYRSTDGGRTWNDTLIEDVTFPNDNLRRPGMQTFADLPNGKVVMSYEMCRDATNADHACEVYVKFSDDGMDWSPADDPGTLVQTTDKRELLHTPYISWTPSGGANGTLLLSGQRVVAGPTGNKTVQTESGTVLFANTSLGQGPWTEISSPITVNPTGGYATGVPSCPGYSTPAIPLADGDSYLYLAATWLGEGNQCEVRYATGHIPTTMGAVGTTFGKCLDVDTNTSRNGNAAQLWECNIASGQDWSKYPDDTIRAMGKCLDVDAQGTANHTKVQLWECNGSGAQQWIYREDQSLWNPQSAKCLDIPAGKTDNGTQLQIYDCNGLWTQRWYFPQ